MIGGRIVFSGGKLLTLDEAALRRRAEEAAHRLDEANAELFTSGAKVSRLVVTTVVPYPTAISRDG